PQLNLRAVSTCSQNIWGLNFRVSAETLRSRTFNSRFIRSFPRIPSMSPSGIYAGLSVVSRGAIDAIDDKHIHTCLFRDQLEPELLPYRGLERGPTDLLCGRNSAIDCSGSGCGVIQLPI